MFFQGKYPKRSYRFRCAQFIITQYIPLGKHNRLLNKGLQDLSELLLPGKRSRKSVQSNVLFCIICRTRWYLGNLLSIEEGRRDEKLRRKLRYVTLKLFQLDGHCVHGAPRFGSFPPILCVQSRKIFAAQKKTPSENDKWRN